MLVETKAFVWRGRGPKFTIYIKKYNTKAGWRIKQPFSLTDPETCFFYFKSKKFFEFVFSQTRNFVMSRLLSF